MSFVGAVLGHGAVQGITGLVGLGQSQRLFEQQLKFDSSIANRDFAQDRKFESKEMDRDTWGHYAQKLQTMLLMESLFFASSFGLSIEGTLPESANDEVVFGFLYSFCLSSSQVFLLLSMVFSFKIQNLVSTYRILPPIRSQQGWLANSMDDPNASLRGKSHIDPCTGGARRMYRARRFRRTRIDRFYRAECQKIERYSILLLILGVCLLAAAGAVLCCLRFVYNNHQNLSSYTYAVVYTVGAFGGLSVLKSVKSDALNTKKVTTHFQRDYKRWKRIEMKRRGKQLLSDSSDDSSDGSSDAHPPEELV